MEHRRKKKKKIRDQEFLNVNGLGAINDSSGTAVRETFSGIDQGGVLFPFHPWKPTHSFRWG